MWPNLQFPADLVTFTEEILNGKLHFLCSVRSLKVCLIKSYFCWQFVILWNDLLYKKENFCCLFFSLIFKSNFSCRGQIIVTRSNKQTKLLKLSFLFLLCWNWFVVLGQDISSFSTCGCTWFINKRKTKVKVCDDSLYLPLSPLIHILMKMMKIKMKMLWIISGKTKHTHQRKTNS